MGMGLLAFRNTFTWARHALFAVLSGCTTIVQGCDREKVLQVWVHAYIFLLLLAICAGWLLYVVGCMPDDT